jgi:hypothetical protein
MITAPRRIAHGARFWVGHGRYAREYGGPRFRASCAAGHMAYPSIKAFHARRYFLRIFFVFREEVTLSTAPRLPAYASEDTRSDEGVRVRIARAGSRKTSSCGSRAAGPCGAAGRSFALVAAEGRARNFERHFHVAAPQLRSPIAAIPSTSRIAGHPPGREVGRRRRRGRPGQCPRALPDDRDLHPARGERRQGPAGCAGRARHAPWRAGGACRRRSARRRS